MTRDAAAAPGTVRPGGRTARTRAAVRDAVLTGLADHGYPGLTVEYVAEHSGVHKTTLYRRWGGVDGLLVDALDLAGEDSWSPPDTGTLEGDLCALADEVAATFGDRATAAAPTAFIAAAFQSERAAQGLRDFYRERFARCGPLISRAIERGEAPPGTDADAVARAVSAPLYFRVLVTREPIDATHARQSALAVLAAIQAGAYTGDAGSASPADAAGDRKAATAQAADPRGADPQGDASTAVSTGAVREPAASAAVRDRAADGHGGAGRSDHSGPTADEHARRRES
ncbi:TetR/AcrR family transcriptional regulator C-terminal ligand-binding domain-containing protein [Streptomyces sp. AC536]|nr:TetR/AcrR family transcriptional regulator C-terminal ligand-binding domain-containing protein [Streptomyces buecherae]QNJ44171.1 TetR/AcrR family transcriptional regulator C-terminal ligand-binding domain-containing protein [Streptomyces buecherae]